MHDIRVCASEAELGIKAAQIGASAIRDAIAARGDANIIVATGASQFSMLAALVREPGIDWTRVTAFHLDEYVGLPDTHPASFRGYLRLRFLAPLDDAPRFVPVNADAPDLLGEITRLNASIAGREIDVCFAGIGENCHLAFNDPPADFETTSPFLIVSLDEACRHQQLGEGWFDSLDAVPTQAISMSVHQMMQSRLMVLTVPNQRKAEAVRAAVEGEVSPLYPASILQRHDNAVLLLDPASASLLRSVSAPAR